MKSNLPSYLVLLISHKLILLHKHHILHILHLHLVLEVLHLHGLLQILVRELTLNGSNAGWTLWTLNTFTLVLAIAGMSDVPNSALHSNFYGWRLHGWRLHGWRLHGWRHRLLTRWWWLVGLSELVPGDPHSLPVDITRRVMRDAGMVLDVDAFCARCSYT